MSTIGPIHCHIMIILSSLPFCFKGMFFLSRATAEENITVYLLSIIVVLQFDVQLR